MFEADKVLIAPDLRLNDLMEKEYSIETPESMILKMNKENHSHRLFLTLK